MKKAKKEEPDDIEIILDVLDDVVRAIWREVVGQFGLRKGNELRGKIMELKMTRAHERSKNKSKEG